MKKYEKGSLIRDVQIAKIEAQQRISKLNKTTLANNNTRKNAKDIEINTKIELDVIKTLHEFQQNHVNNYLERANINLPVTINTDAINEMTKDIIKQVPNFPELLFKDSEKLYTEFKDIPYVNNLAVYFSKFIKSFNPKMDSMFYPTRSNSGDNTTKEILENTNPFNVPFLIKDIRKNTMAYYQLYSKFGLFNSVKKSAETIFESLKLRIRFIKMNKKESLKHERRIMDRFNKILRSSSYSSLGELLASMYQQYIFLGACFYKFDSYNYKVYLLDQDNLLIGYKNNPIQPQITHVIVRAANYAYYNFFKQNIVGVLEPIAGAGHPVMGLNSMSTGVSPGSGYTIYPNYTQPPSKMNLNNLYYIIDSKDVLIFRNEPFRQNNLHFESPLHYCIDELESYIKTLTIKKATANIAYSDIHVVSTENPLKFIEKATDPLQLQVIIERSNNLQRDIKNAFDNTSIDKDNIVTAEAVSNVYALQKSYDMRREMTKEFNIYENQILHYFGIRISAIDAMASSGSETNAGRGSVDIQNSLFEQSVLTFATKVLPAFTTIINSILLDSWHQDQVNPDCRDFIYSDLHKNIKSEDDVIDNVIVEYGINSNLTLGTKTQNTSITTTAYTSGLMSLDEARDELNLAESEENVLEDGFAGNNADIDVKAQKAVEELKSISGLNKGGNSPQDPTKRKSHQ